MNNENEQYPEDWIHCRVHLNPKTGEVHGDGDYAVLAFIRALKEKALKVEEREGEQVLKKLDEIAKSINCLQSNVDVSQVWVTNKVREWEGRYFNKRNTRGLEPV